MGLVIGTKKIYFKYGKEAVNFFKNGLPTTQTKPTTTCVIADTETSNTLTSVKVRLHHHDKNEKIVGRRFAVSKAINSLDNAELKAELWQGVKNNLKLK